MVNTVSAEELETSIALLGVTASDVVTAFSAEELETSTALLGVTASVVADAVSAEELETSTVLLGVAASVVANAFSGEELETSTTLLGVTASVVVNADSAEELEILVRKFDFCGAAVLHIQFDGRECIWLLSVGFAEDMAFFDELSPRSEYFCKISSVFLFVDSLAIEFSSVAIIDFSEIFLWTKNLCLSYMTFEPAGRLISLVISGYDRFSKRLTSFTMPIY